MKNALSLANIALRGLMEFAIVLGFAYWGYRTGGTTAGKIGLAIAAPAVGFGFWGLVDFRQAGKAAEVLRLLQELLLSGSAAAA